MSLREAAEKALEALEDIFGHEKIDVGAINALRAALAEADDRKCTCHPDDNPPQPCPKQFALGECRQATALTEPDEPVAWFESPYGEVRVNPLYKFQFPSSLLSWQIPLYTHPPRREPLTEDEIIKLGVCNGVLPLLHDDTYDELVRIARWVERAHGIGGDE